ncbi:MAG TPA: hypothetical protein VK470_05510 [Bacteroidota bacterium]|nr:hypothetical protein [Bacteroidota bacterium]
MKYTFILLAALAIIGCQERYDIKSLPLATDLPVVGDTTYIQKGIWTGFNHPRTIIYGTDQLLYVCDTDSNRIVMLNQAGQILSVRSGILHPMSIAQDARLDLLVGAETLERTTGDTIGVVLRIKLVDADHQLGRARIDTIWKEPARPRRRFVGIGAIQNDEYLVLRDGPDNTSIVDPDSRVLRFRYVHVNAEARKDSFITPLGDLQSGIGGAITYINRPTGLATFPGSSDFILVQQTDGIQYSVVWMAYSKTSDFEGWIPKYDPALPEQRGTDIITPNRFSNARGVGIDRLKRDIFIVDAEQDSVVKFNSRGRFKVESFGARTPGITLKSPQGAAVAENTLYICDTGNNRIVLYRLSTDF